MESVSGKELDHFFYQWLWSAGHPIIKVSWGTETTGKQIDNQQVLIQQRGKQLFSFPVGNEYYLRRRICRPADRND